jgi:hypothetical protein
MSAAVPRAMRANALPSEGSTTSIACPVADATQRLSMKWCDPLVAVQPPSMARLRVSLPPDY